MIYIRLSGRFGNYLFQIAAGASLAYQHNTNFKVVIASDSESIATTVSESMESYLTPFRNDVFKNLSFVYDIPHNAETYIWRDFPYKPIPYHDKDIIIDGYFQSYRYLDTSYLFKQYAMSKERNERLWKKYGDILNKNPVCIHVRRGDYLNIPERFSICSKAYFESAISLIGRDKTYLIISDDQAWCKRNFRETIFHFADRGNDMLDDFYLQSLCTHNIISNSSFSWWGAWLNPNPNKIVVYPTPWFGPHYSHYDTCDLCPKDWIALPNRTPFRYRMKADWIRFTMKIQRLLK